MRITKLKTLHMTDPIGIDVNPYFSWILESDENNTFQSGYHLKVSDEAGITVMDTGKVDSSQNTYIPYTGAPLHSQTCYTITLTVYDNHQNYAQTTGSFETALLQTDDWKAQWVIPQKKRRKSKPGFGKQSPATLFRQKVILKAVPMRARLYATCHGSYELFVNGEAPDDRVFAPEHTVYEKYLCYQTYDVTRLLESGENVIGMYVGDGWYHCPNAKPNMKNDGQHAILFQLEVFYGDGQKETFCSSESARVSFGPVISSDLYAGEIYDASKDQENWNKADFDDSSWYKVKVNTSKYRYDNLKAQLGEPVVRVQEFPALSISISPKGETILDFGQNMAGRVRMKTNLKLGQRIKLMHCEVLDKDGNYFNNILSAGGVGKGVEQTDEYISCGRPDTYEPHFTYHGFRYAKILIDDKNPEDASITVSATDFTAIALSTAKENCGSFECSDDRLNRLYQNIRWSQTSNMLSIPTDCPQREKAGWTGDMLVYAKTAMLNEDCTSIFSRWLYNMQLDQDKYGIVPMVVPENGNYPLTGKLISLSAGGKGKGTSSGWGDAAVVVPYSMYEVTGNTEILKQQYYCMRRWVDYIIEQAEKKRPKGSLLSDETEKYLWDTGYHYGEWLIPSQNKNGLDMKNLSAIMKSSSCYTAPIYGWNSVNTFAHIAEILSKNTEDNTIYETDVKKYKPIADKMRQAIQNGVISEEGDMPSDLMGAYVLPIAFDLVPEKHQARFTSNLLTSIVKNDGCMDTGFLTSQHLLFALSKTGNFKAAFDLLWQSKTPSWLSEVDAGATTIWENTFGYDENGNPLSLSFNHYSFGAVADWIYQYECGIRPLAPGYKQILIKPVLDGRLTSCSRTFQSMQGEIHVKWMIEGDKFSMDVRIPCNTSARIELVDGSVYETGSGEYHYECKI